MAAWWAGLLGGRAGAEDGAAWVDGIPGAPFESLVVVPVPEPRRGKNRVHLDVVGDVAEIVARGATVLDALPQWTVLADPRGNELCAFPRAHDPA